MTVSANDHTFDELIISTLARQLKNGDRVFTGVASPVQMLATLLAQATHAPDLLYFTILGTINPNPQFVPYSTGDPHLFDRCENAITFPEIFDLANKGRMDVAFLGGVQIDQFGSLNMSIIGSDPHRPKVRLPGGAGGPLMIRSFRRVISWRPNHSKKNLVKELPFITSPGWIPVAKGSRHGGPDTIVTDLCVFQFDRSSKRISLQSVHPGVKVTDIQEKTGFQFKIPRKIKETAAPSKREIEILSSQIDPENIRKTLVSPPK